jgi:ketosteroid isomerase-like protein
VDLGTRTGLVPNQRPPLAAHLDSGDTGRAMSKENVELVRGMQPAPDVDIAALFRDEASAAGLQAAVAPLLHPDFEAVMMTGIGVETYRGVDGLGRAWLDWLEPWESYRTEIEDTLDFGNRVLVLPRDHGRRHGSQSEVTMQAAAVWTVADGKIVRAVFYSDRAAALEVVGLRE